MLRKWLKRREAKIPARRSVYKANLEFLEDRLAPAVFTVINTNDGGPGSLAQAISDAETTVNVGEVPDEIDFNIPGSGVHTIQPSSSLPILTEAVIIDGYT